VRVQQIGDANLFLHATVFRLSLGEG